MKENLSFLLRTIATVSIVLGPRLVGAAGGSTTILRPMETLVDFISGPLAMVLVALGLAGALISLIFMGGQFIGRLLWAFFGGVGLFMVGYLRDFIADTAR